MDSNQKKTNRPVEFLIFLVVIICAALIIVDIYTNVAGELQGAFFMSLA